MNKIFELKCPKILDLEILLIINLEVVWGLNYHCALLLSTINNQNKQRKQNKQRNNGITDNGPKYHFDQS